jgi:hypothetical protein
MKNSFYTANRRQERAAERNEFVRASYYQAHTLRRWAAYKVQCLTAGGWGYYAW